MACEKLPGIALNCSQGSICALIVPSYPHCPLNEDFCIKADADVVGIGVLVAFVVTAAIALFTTYFSLAVQLVDYIHCGAQATSPIQKAVLCILRKVYSCLKLFPSRWKSNSKLRRERLVKFCEDFLLALSDQQLVTGLAILVAGWASRKDATVYQFEMITDTAWMSSDVHLLTVGQLRGFFKSNPHTRHWRAIGMLCTFVLIFVANVYQGHFEWFDKFHYPAQCLFDDLHHSPSKVHGRAAAYMYTWTAFLVYGYGRAIIPLYTNIGSWRLDLLAKRHHESGVKAYLLDIFWLISGEPFNVLVIQTLWFIYGSWSLWIDRRDAENYGVIQEGENAWGFGQIVPLFLLGLPLFNAMDFFIGLRKIGAHEELRRFSVIESDQDIVRTEMIAMQNSENNIPKLGDL